MGLLAAGVIMTQPEMVAPAINAHPKGAPPILPMLFVVLACGAVSGFHSLVSSGTSSKQCDAEKSALSIGYGSMLLEGMLAVFVIIACGAGIGLGLVDKGQTFIGTEAFTHYYADWATINNHGIGAKIGAFVAGGAKMLNGIWIPHEIAITLIGVFIVSFAATTLDTATRIQRYIVGELAKLCKVPALSRKHPATLIAVSTAFLLAFHNGSGTGALILWPLFGCTNQLLAGMALLVVTVYLAHKKYPIYYTLIPMLFMVAVTGWAMIDTLDRFFKDRNWLLFGIGIIIFALEIWMIIESAIVVKNVLTDSDENEDDAEIITEELET
jgi:carbon starvation protein